MAEPALVEFTLQGVSIYLGQTSLPKDMLAKFKPPEQKLIIRINIQDLQQSDQPIILHKQPKEDQSISEDQDESKLQDIIENLEEVEVDGQQEGEQSLYDKESSLNEDIWPKESKKLTKRQLGLDDNLVQLPDKKPRKKRKIFFSEEDLVMKAAKEEKRKQYLMRQIEEQKCNTLNKIINETGRKFKQRAKQQNQIAKDRFRRLPLNQPCVRMRITSEGTSVTLSHNRPSEQLLRHEYWRDSIQRVPKQNCKCGKLSKYKSRDGIHFCSLVCKP